MKKSARRYGIHIYGLILSGFDYQETNPILPHEVHFAPSIVKVITDSLITEFHRISW